MTSDIYGTIIKISWRCFEKEYRIPSQIIQIILMNRIENSLSSWRVNPDIQIFFSFFSFLLFWILKLGKQWNHSIYSSIVHNISICQLFIVHFQTFRHFQTSNLHFFKIIIIIINNYRFKNTFFSEQIRNNSNFLVWFIVPYTKKNHYINKLCKDVYIFKLFINRKNDE